MTLDLESMLIKRNKNLKSDLLDNHNPKYSLYWYYNNSLQGFKDNNEDPRMLKYI